MSGVCGEREIERVRVWKERAIYRVCVWVCVWRD